MARPLPPGYSEGPATHSQGSFHAPSMAERASVASSNAPFSAIGALLSQPYDSDDEDGRSIKNPQSYQGIQSQSQNQGVRSGDVRSATTRNGYGVSEKVHSLEGDVGGQSARPRSIVHFPGPKIGQAPAQQPQHHQAPRQPVYSGHARHPPQPMQSPRFPNPTHPGPRSPHPNRPQPTLHIPHSPALSPHPLPKPSTPISPALAAAPSSAASFSSYGGLTPPRSAFSGADNRSSVASSSASIAAYDSMEKTHSLMRGGEDELMAPVNTRRPQRKRSLSANALQGFRRTVMGQPGGEFWKRFSVMAKLDTNKESDWLVEEQARKRRIKITAIVGIVLIAIIIAGVALGVTLANNDSDDARPKSVS